MQSSLAPPPFYYEYGRLTPCTRLLKNIIAQIEQKFKEKHNKQNEISVETIEYVHKPQ